MPRDARLGFVVGVTLVILIAAIFYSGDGTASTAGNVGTPGTEVLRTERAPAPGLPPIARHRTHTVKDGETLTGLAQQYYNDPALSSLLFRANRSQLRTPQDLPVGTVLIIPEAKEE